MRTFRACWSSYLVMTICIGIIPIIATPLALRGDKGAAPIAVVGWAALLFTYLWLARFRLDFMSERVGYSSLFRRYSSIRRDSITEADFTSETSPFEGRNTFVVRGARGEEIRINAKVFSREALQQLFHLGPQRSNQAMEPTASRRTARFSDD
jgi:hypothetical protein